MYRFQVNNQRYGECYENSIALVLHTLYLLRKTSSCHGYMQVSQQATAFPALTNCGSSSLHDSETTQAKIHLKVYVSFLLSPLSAILPISLVCLYFMYLKLYGTSRFSQVLFHSFPIMFTIYPSRNPSATTAYLITWHLNLYVSLSLHLCSCSDSTGMFLFISLK